MHSSTSVWSVQHPNAGPNIQHIFYDLIIMNFQGWHSTVLVQLMKLRPVVQSCQHTCAQSTCLGKQLCKACRGLLERAWAGHHIQTSADSKKIQIFTSDAIGAAWHRMTFWPIPPLSIRVLFKFLPLYFLVAYFILLKLCY